MNRRTLMLGVATILIASMLAGAGTLAYFSDIEISTGNKFIAGTFGIEINGESLPFKAGNIIPGWSHEETHGVTNIGTVAGEVCITAENFADPSTYYSGYYAEPAEPEPSTDVSPEDFAEILYMKIEADLDHDAQYSFETLLYDGPLYGMETARFGIDAGEYIECKFTAYFPTDLADPNLYQADGVECDIVFYGTTEISIAP